MPGTLVVDMDGTLIDSNYQHALAWYRAFRDSDIVLPVWQLHRHIGMGGDQLVAAVAGDEVEQRLGDALRQAHQQHYAPMQDEVAALDGATELLVAARDAGARVVLASSGKADEVRSALELLGGEDLVDAWTSSDDAAATKPSPDVVQSALAKVDADPASAVMVGDSTWDAVAAGRAGVRAVALWTGGFSAAELTDAGADRVYRSLPELTGDVPSLVG